jgi:twitching motility protein PilT
MSEGNAIDALFRGMFDAKASDLHLCVGSPPIIRKDGHMQPLNPGAAPMTAQALIQLLGPIMPEKNRKEFTEKHDTDFA